MSTSPPAQGGPSPSAGTAKVLEADIRGQTAAYAGVARDGPPAWGPSLEQEILRSGFDRVVLTGMGSSFFATLAAEGWLTRRGVTAQARLASELLHDGPPVLPRDLLVMVSQSGASVESVRLLELAAERGATTLAITRDPTSPAAALAGAVMTLDVPADHGVAIKTFGASILALSYLADRLSGSHAPWAETAHDAVEKLSHLTEQPARGLGFDLGKDARAMVTLSRGSLQPAARESALLVNEVAKMPAWSEDAGQFRHGIIELAGPTVVTSLLVEDGPGTELQTGLATELGRTGAQVIATAPPHLAQRLTDVGARVIGVPDVDPPFGVLAHVMCFQWLALGLAEARRVEPGRFLHAQEVVSFEAGASRA